MNEAAKIRHDENGPFVRSAREVSFGLPQTETVYAIRVLYSNGDVQYWNANATPQDDGTLTDLHRSAFRLAKEMGTSLVSIEPVSRDVTISATEWVSSE